jgi:ribosomal protein S18 acetylase RimI-like enzyme
MMRPENMRRNPLICDSMLSCTMLCGGCLARLAGCPAATFDQGSSLMHCEIRDASDGDLPAIARLHATSWKVAYRGILRDAFLDHDLEGNRAQRWAGIFDRMAPRDRVLIAMLERSPAGFISGWTTAAMDCEPGFDLHVDNLHVRPDLRGQGLGVALMQSLSKRQTPDGSVRGYLWVLDGNEAAYRFYVRLGGRVSDQRQIEFGGAMVGETRIVWDDFRSLSLWPRCDSQ